MSATPHALPSVRRLQSLKLCHGANIASEILACDLDDAREYAHLNRPEDLAEYRRALRLHDDEEESQ